MEKSRKLFLQGLEKLMRIRVQREINKWPPLCKGALYQPQRPKRKVNYVNNV